MSQQTDEAMAAMIAAASLYGIEREALIVGVIDPDGQRYSTHVGRAVETDPAIALQIVAKDLVAEASEQATATFDDAQCPRCGSLRYVLRLRRGKRKYDRRQRYECMDCDHHGPDR